MIGFNDTNTQTDNTEYYEMEGKNERWRKMGRSIYTNFPRVLKFGYGMVAASGV